MENEKMQVKAIKLSRTVPLMLSLTTSILAVEVILCPRWKITF